VKEDVGGRKLVEVETSDRLTFACHAKITC
jgi:hypothetical protein